MGEIFYEKGKKYNCRVKGIPYFRTSVTIQGKTRQVYGDGEKDARRRIDALKAEAKTGIDFDKKNSKVGPTFNYWLYNVKRVDKDIKASSFARYDCAYRNHIEPHNIMDRPLSKLSTPIMQDYVTELHETFGCSSATIESVLKVWKMFLDWAIEEGYLLKNVAKLVSVPGKYNKRSREIMIFNAKERAQLIQYMDETHYQYDTLIKLAFATGMRVGELLALRWDDISENAINVRASTAVVNHVAKDGSHERYREVWETKTKNSVRTIPLLRSTNLMLYDHWREQQEYFRKYKLGKPEYVFTTNAGNMIDASSFAKSYKALLKRAGIPYRKFHCVRHTFGTEAIRRGVNVKDLQMLMGHSDIETTYIYVHADEESKKSAIERMGDLI